MRVPLCSILFLCTQPRLIFLRPLAVLSHLLPLFAQDIIDHYGNARSHRRASAHHGEARLVRLHYVYEYIIKITLDTFCFNRLNWFRRLCWLELSGHWLWRVSINWNCQGNWFRRLSMYWSCPDNWFRWLSIDWNCPENWFRRRCINCKCVSNGFRTLFIIWNCLNNWFQRWEVNWNYPHS